MKKTLLLCTIMIVAFIISCDKSKDRIILGPSSKTIENNPRNSLDWSGTYVGILPCADCEAVQAILVLKDDNTYSASYHYLGNNEAVFSEQGSFEWDIKGYIITFLNSQRHKYKVSDGKIFSLDIDEEVITGSLENMYILNKRL